MGAFALKPSRKTRGRDIFTQLRPNKRGKMRTSVPKISFKKTAMSDKTIAAPVVERKNEPFFIRAPSKNVRNAFFRFADAFFQHSAYFLRKNSAIFKKLARIMLLYKA